MEDGRNDHLEEGTKAKAYYQTENASDSQQSSTGEESDAESQMSDVDDLTTMSLYQFSDDDHSVTARSIKLPIFDAIFDDTESAKIIMDSGATSLYLGKDMAQKLCAEVTKIKPRKVRVADKEIITTTGICTVEMKLGNLPPETVTAYVFPLHKVDLILGLPWLQKHNPHIDFRDMCYEFARNGRQYYVYPSTSENKSIKIASPEDFANYIDEDTELYLLRPDEQDDEKAPLLSGKSVTKGKAKKIARKISTWVTNMKSWIQRRCPKLLRNIGTPAKLQPLTINTGDHEPIRIKPRHHSPLDLAKIKKFLDENIQNGVITESQSPWSAPIVLATKPDGSTRVCIDYRALNRITTKDAHSLPRIDESFSYLAGANTLRHSISNLAIGGFRWTTFPKKRRHSPRAMVNFNGMSCLSV